MDFVFKSTNRRRDPTAKVIILNTKLIISGQAESSKHTSNLSGNGQKTPPDKWFDYWPM